QTHAGERSDRLITSKADQLSILQQLQTAETSARALVVEANANLDGIQADRVLAETRVTKQTHVVSEAEAQLIAATERLATANADAERLRARHEVLEQARAELAGFASGAKTLLAKNFPTRGVLSELLNVP